MKRDKLFLKTRILREIFNIAPKRFQEKDLGNHYLAKKFHISCNELKNNIEFLVDMGLINRWSIRNKERVYEWIITDKGLDYLEKREMEKNQLKFNETVAFTGSLIALITIYNFMVKSTNLKDYSTNYWSITIIFLILVLLCLLPLTNFIFNFWKRSLLKNET